MMELSVGSLTKQTSIYGLFQIAQKAAALVVIPIYTHYLTPSEFGTLDILYLIVWLVGIVGGSKLDAAFIRYYGSAESNNTVNELLSSALIALIAFTTGFCVIAALAAKPVLEFMYTSGARPFTGYYLALAATWLQLVGSLPLTFLRTRQEALLVGKISMVHSLGGTLVGLLCVTALGMGYEGILVGTVASGIFFVILSYSVLFKRILLPFSFSYGLRLLRFSIPMLPAPLFMYALNYADRFFLSRYWDLGEVGTYAMAYKFAMIANLLVTAPFEGMWAVNQFALHEAGQKQTFQRLALLYVSILFIVALGISYFSYEITVLTIDTKYSGLLSVVAPLSVGIAIWGIVPTMDLGFQITNKTWLRSLTTGIGALINVLLNWILIPPFGIRGAAVATLLSFCILAWTTHLFNRPLTDYFIDVRKAAKLAILLFCLSNLAYLDSYVSYSVFVAIRLLGVVGFTAFCLKINEIRLKELWMRLGASALRMFDK